MGKHELNRRARRLLCEQLESRCVLSVAGGADFHAVMVAGDPNGSPADLPSARIDTNTTTSPFAGVGSLQINTNRGTYICTATPIDSTHLLTAGHCVDINNDGKSDKKDGIRTVNFNLNYGGNLTHQLPASRWDVNPNFTGFNRPSINDDLAVITLSGALPAGVPIYTLPTTDLAAGTTLTMVGYGRSGDGVNGYTLDASWTVKRRGENNADAFYAQDDRFQAAANEVFRFDFDGPTGNGSFGGPTLGNDRETTLGGGDSGGPSFVLRPSVDGVPPDPKLATSYVLVGVNTFTQGTNAPKFGSLGGGINVFPYLGWILGPHAAAGGVSGGGGAVSQNASTFSAMDTALLAAPPTDFDFSSGTLADASASSGTAYAMASSSAQIAISFEGRAEVAQPALPANRSLSVVAKRSLPGIRFTQDATNEDAAANIELGDRTPAIDAVFDRWS